MVTVDVVVFGFFDQAFRVLLIRRGQEPFAGKWAIPGGFLELDEPVETAVRRELKEETGLEIPGPIASIGFFGDPGRDPRGRTITLAHAALLPGGPHEIKGGDDAAEAAWIKVGDPVDLAFDHDKIMERAGGWLRHGLLWKELALALLPEQFLRVDVLSCFRAVDLPDDSVSFWLDRITATGKIRALGPLRKRFQVVDPAR